MTAATSSALFQRACTVQVGSLLIPAGQGLGLDVQFAVRKGVKVTAGGTKPQPNTCDLTIYNLSPSHQKELEQSTVPGAKRTKVPVVISAGYAGRSSVIFSGELRAGQTIGDGPDAITELSTGDGDDALTQTRLSIALGAGATGTDGIKAILTALGVGEGNLKTGLARLQGQALAAQLFSKGVVLKGSAAVLMTSFCRSTGLSWSIQDGALQLTAVGQPTDGDAILIDAEHGMVGSPSVDTKGILSVSTEMIPDVRPGQKIRMNAKRITGGYRILSVETKGDTAGDEWGHSIEAARY